MFGILFFLSIGVAQAGGGRGHSYKINCGDLAKNVIRPVDGVNRSFSMLQRGLREGEIQFLNKEEEYLLFSIYKSGGSEIEGSASAQAREILILSQMIFVMNWASKMSVNEEQFQNFFQGGMLGVIHAIEKFDPSMNGRLSTYAAWWISREIKNMKWEDRLIRVPAYMREVYSKWELARKELLLRLDREPTDEEISAQIQVTPEQVSYFISGFKCTQTSMSELGKGSKELPDFDIPDKAIETSELAENAEYLGHMLQVAEKVLDEREFKIIRLRFNLGGLMAEPMTLKEIGKVIGITRERVRQIEAEALEKIRWHLERE